MKAYGGVQVYVDLDCNVMLLNIRSLARNLVHCSLLALSIDRLSLLCKASGTLAV
jgi:hypothetical protein